MCTAKPMPDHALSLVQRSSQSLLPTEDTDGVFQSVLHIGRKTELSVACQPKLMSRAVTKFSVTFGMPSAMARRITQARERAGLSQKQLADRIGVAQQTVNSLERQESGRTSRILDLALAMDVDPFWLQNGEPATAQPLLPGATSQPDQPIAYDLGISSGTTIEVSDTEYVALTRYDCAISAGAGSILDPHAEPLDFHFFERQWLRSITRAAPEKLAVLRVDGDSMVSTLHDGDWVLIDRSQDRLGREGIYAIAVNDVAWIKRLSLNLRQRLVRIISDNDAYPMQELPEEDLAVIGRAVWVVGRRLS